MSLKHEGEFFFVSNFHCKVLIFLRSLDLTEISAVDNVTNDKGEILAKIWESKGFQEVYDYKGVNLRKNRLRRK